MTTPSLLVMSRSHAWNAVSVGAHSPVPSSVRSSSEVSAVNEPGKGPERLWLSPKLRYVRLVRSESWDGTCTQPVTGEVQLREIG